MLDAVCAIPGSSTQLDGHCSYDPRYPELVEEVVANFRPGDEAELVTLDLCVHENLLIEGVLGRYRNAELFDRYAPSASEPLVASTLPRVVLQPTELFDPEGAHFLPVDPARIEGEIDGIAGTWSLSDMDRTEKSLHFKRCYNLLKLGGWYVLGDYVALADNREYRAALRELSDARFAQWEQDEVPGHYLLTAIWEERKEVLLFDHDWDPYWFPETVDAYLNRLRHVGFENVESPWQEGLRAVFVARKPL